MQFLSKRSPEDLQSIRIARQVNPITRNGSIRKAKAEQSFNLIQLIRSLFTTPRRRATSKKGRGRGTTFRTISVRWQEEGREEVACYVVYYRLVFIIFGAGEAWNVNKRFSLGVRSISRLVGLGSGLGGDFRGYWGRSGIFGSPPLGAAVAPL